MNIQKAAKWFGIVLLLVGIIGFIPGLTPDGKILGIFEVNTLHNIIHVLTGLVALFSAGSEDAARNYFRIFGIVYALVTVIGLIQGTTVLGLIPVNAADNILHIAITIFALSLGFSGPKSMVKSA